MQAVAESLVELTENVGIDRDTCVLHARAAQIALQDQGLRAVPFPCQLTVRNPAYVQVAADLGRAPDDVEDHAVLAAAGAWTVALGFNEEPTEGRYNGHLVVAVEGRWLLDLTLNQCNRPACGIVLPPTLALEARPLIQGKLEEAGTFLNGCAVCYTPKRGDRSFMEESWHLWMRPEMRASRERLMGVVRRRVAELRHDPIERVAS
jgi:hypothetical protein